MINSIALKFGSLPDAIPLSFAVTPITVFVGPNNSGKSAVLQEIEQAFNQAFVQPTSKILKSVEFKSIDEKSAKDILERMTVEKLPGEQHYVGHVYASMAGQRCLVYPGNFIAGLVGLNGLNENSVYAQQIGSAYLRFMVKRLDGPSRISLSNDQEFGDLQTAATNALQTIFRDDILRERIRSMIYSALGRYLVLDPTLGGRIRIRLSSRPPKDCDEEQGLTSRSSAFHSEAWLVSSQSDGVKAFIGIITEVLAGVSDNYLLDEPEAFLHPSLAFTLGKTLSVSLLRSRCLLLRTVPSFSWDAFNLGFQLT